MTAPDPKNAGGETLITFEDLDLGGRAMGPLPSGYRGFTWSDSAWFMTRAFVSSVCPGSQIGLLNAHGKDITIERKHPFDLKGVSLYALWADKVQVGVEGWEKQVRKYVTTQTVSRGSTTHCALDYQGVDHIKLKTGGTHVVITTITVLFRRDCSRIFEEAC